jgi:hypothetical protein
MLIMQYELPYFWISVTVIGQKTILILLSVANLSQPGMSCDCLLKSTQKSVNSVQGQSNFKWRWTKAAGNKLLHLPFGDHTQS